MYVALHGFKPIHEILVLFGQQIFFTIAVDQVENLKSIPVPHRNTEGVVGQIMPTKLLLA